MLFSNNVRANCGAHPRLLHPQAPGRTTANPGRCSTPPPAAPPSAGSRCIGQVQRERPTQLGRRRDHVQPGALNLQLRFDRHAASGRCRPSPNRAIICASDTGSPISIPTPLSPAAQPLPRRLATHGVVGADPARRARRRGLHHRLPSQIRVPVPGRNHVRAHHRAPPPDLGPPAPSNPPDRAPRDPPRSPHPSRHVLTPPTCDTRVPVVSPRPSPALRPPPTKPRGLHLLHLVLDGDESRLMRSRHGCWLSV